MMHDMPAGSSIGQPVRGRGVRALPLVPMAGLAAGLPAVLLVALLVTSGCSTREEVSTLAPDSTLVYAGKKPGDITASITFADKSRVSKRTGKRLGVTRVFDLAEDGRVYAFVDLQNIQARGERGLDFHLVWLKPNGVTAYKKRIEVAPSDSLQALTSALSIVPGKRGPGEYRLRVYLFRELIAEKSFTLRGEGAEAQEEGSEEM